MYDLRIRRPKMKGCFSIFGSGDRRTPASSSFLGAEDWVEDRHRPFCGGETPLSIFSMFKIVKPMVTLNILSDIARYDTHDAGTLTPKRRTMRSRDTFWCYVA